MTKLRHELRGEREEQVKKKLFATKIQNRTQGIMRRHRPSQMAHKKTHQQWQVYRTWQRKLCWAEKRKQRRKQRKTNSVIKIGKKPPRLQKNKEGHLWTGCWSDWEARVSFEDTSRIIQFFACKKASINTLGLGWQGRGIWYDDFYFTYISKFIFCFVFIFIAAKSWKC